MEWSNQNRFNSFNTWKGLTYMEHYRRIVDAVRDNDPLPVPIEARIDCTLACNLNCEWCNSRRYRGKGHILTPEHVHRVLDFLASWGVRSILWAGGGEPCTHPAMADFLSDTVVKGMDTAMLTNLSASDDDLLNTMGKTCRWVGVSVDAGSDNLYKQLKGFDHYARVLRNIQTLSASPTCDTSYKFLLTPDNQHEVLIACRRARESGAHEFVVRPVDYGHQGVGGHAAPEFDMMSLRAKFDLCHELETKTFRVFTVDHKFNIRTLKPMPKLFTECWAAPLKIHLAPDCKIYLCDDQYYQPHYQIGDYTNPEDIMRFWGGERHLALLRAHTPRTCNTRCCVGPYCEQAQRLIVDDDDPMCLEFP